jgi:hypothetical protein
MNSSYIRNSILIHRRGDPPLICSEVVDGRTVTTLAIDGYVICPKEQLQELAASLRPGGSRWDASAGGVVADVPAAAV